MKNVKLVPISIFIPDGDGLSYEDLSILEDDGRRAFELTNSFPLNLEYVLENGEVLGVLAPKECLEYLSDKDELIQNILDFGFEDIVHHLYWHVDDKVLYVKHEEGTVVLFSVYVSLFSSINILLGIS